MLETVILVVCFILLVWSSITDLRTTEVPDWLSHSTIVLGFVLNGADSWLTHSWAPLIASGIGFGVCLAFGLLTYYGGQWGGGDSKIIMALGSLLGLTFTLDTKLVWFAVYFLIAGALYGIGWTVWLAMTRKHRFIPAYKAIIHTTYAKVIRISGFVLLGVFGVFSFFMHDAQLKIVTLILAVFFPFIAHVFLFVKAVENCMTREATPDKLLEGDWITKDVIVGGQSIFVAGKLGISQKKIDELKHLSKTHHNISITVKDGIPFVPAFLIAFLMMIGLGNPFLFI